MLKRSRRYRPWLCLFLSAILLVLPLLGIWRSSDGLMAAETQPHSPDDLSVRPFGHPPPPAPNVTTVADRDEKSTDLSHLGKNLRIPVEVIEKGAPPKWVYVEISTTPIPEPALPLLLIPASALLLTRRRIYSR